MPPLPDELPALTTGAGVTHVLVPAWHVVRWSADEAYARLCDAVREDPTQAADWDAVRPLSELAEEGVEDADQSSMGYLDASFRTVDGAHLVRAHVDIETDIGTHLVVDGDDAGRVLERIAGTSVMLNLRGPINWPPRGEGANESADAKIGRDRSARRVELGRAVVIEVERPAAYRLVVGGWAFDSRVFLPVDLESYDRVQPLRSVVAAFAHLTERPSWEIAIVGHTDASGEADFNEALGMLRAQSVASFLVGDRERWAAHAAMHASVRDIQVVLAWLATFCATPCHPGAIDGVFGERTAAALSAWRSLRGGESAGPSKPNVDDWAAAFAAFDEWMATTPVGDPRGVRPGLEARARVLSSGERVAPVNGRSRRVELLLLPEGMPDGELLEDYVYATHDLAELGDELPEEGVIPGHCQHSCSIAWLDQLTFFGSGVCGLSFTTSGRSHRRVLPSQRSGRRFLAAA